MLHSPPPLSDALTCFHAKISPLLFFHLLLPYFLPNSTVKGSAPFPVSATFSTPTTPIHPLRVVQALPAVAPAHVVVALDASNGAFALHFTALFLLQQVFENGKQIALWHIILPLQAHVSLAQLVS